MTWNIGDDFQSPIDADPMHSVLSDSLHQDALDSLLGLDPLASHSGPGLESHTLFAHDLNDEYPALIEPVHNSDISFGSGYYENSPLNGEKLYHSGDGHVYDIDGNKVR